MASSTIRLGTASPATQATTAETLAQLEQLARRAAANKVDILLLPEAYIGGYPRGTHFGCVIGSRSQEGREEYLRYFQNAVDLGDTVGDGAGAGQAWVDRALPSDRPTGSDDGNDGPSRRGDGTREELERIARETGLFIITGLIEKTGGSMYCSVVYACPKSGIIGKRRKVMPTGTERLVWAQGSPATLRAVSTTIRGVRINLAAAICWENYMPLVRQALYAQNINLYLAPTADGRDTWLSLLRTTAIEGRCFVVSSNMCVRDKLATSATTTTNGHSTRLPKPTSTSTEDAAIANSDRDPSPLSPLSKAPAHEPPHRRKSCVTEEGFEIALPTTTSPSRAQSSPDHTRQHQRRLSVFDEDGNEIVLPCSPPERQTSSSRGRPKTRRQSVFDEDGNEIVLCGGTGNHSGGGDGEESTVSYEMAVTTKPFATSGTTKKTGGGGEGEFISRGGSAIVSPFGDVLAGPQWEDDEGIIYADVDFQDCIRGRLDLDTAGSYSRNDSFRFEVRGLDLTPLPY